MIRGFKQLAGLLLILCLVILFGFLYSPVNQECGENYHGDKILTVNGRTLNLELADNDAERAKGLSDRKCISESEGMLFVYKEAGPQCFWMKDMQFSLDIIWLDSNKRVIKIEPDVSPKTYPSYFCANSPAKYVIEVKAGQSRKLGLNIGTVLGL